MTILKISRPFGQAFIFSILLLALILTVCELLLRTEAVKNFLPTPTLSKSQLYPELDVKWTRLEELSKNKKVNCFFLGSSMTDADLDPEIFSESLITNGGKKLTCFNFGLTGFKAEGSAVLARLLYDKYQPDLILLGVSAGDFDPNSSATRDVINSPWFQMMTGNFSLDGWLVEHSITYRFLLTLPKFRNRDYVRELKKTEEVIRQDGFRDMTAHLGITGDLGDIRLKDYSINPYDLAAIDEILSLQNKTTSVIVVEMPIDPAFLPNYVEVGQEGYLRKFFDPIKDHLQERGFSLISTQSEIAGLILFENWYNENHLNSSGAKIFSRWLAEKIGKN